MTFTYDVSPTKFLYRFNLDRTVIQDFVCRLENSSFSDEEFDEYASDKWNYECDESAFHDWIRFEGDEIFREMEKRYAKKEKAKDRRPVERPGVHDQSQGPSKEGMRRVRAHRNHGRMGSGVHLGSGRREAARLPGMLRRQKRRVHAEEVEGGLGQGLPQFSKILGRQTAQEGGK